MDAQLYRGINVKALLVRTLKDIWQTQFFYRCAIKSKHLAKWCKIIPLPAIFRQENAGYLRLFHPFLNDILHPHNKSYTLSYTRKCQSVKYFSVPGVGNVGYFYKTFFGEKGEAFNENSPMLLFSGKRPSSNSPVIRRTETQFFSFSYVNPRHL